MDPKGTTVPIWITGKVSGGSGPPKDIAVAVNGTIRGVGNTFRLATGGGEIMGLLVPETAFRKGRNDVQVYEVQGGTRLLRWAARDLAGGGRPRPRLLVVEAVLDLGQHVVAASFT